MIELFHKMSAMAKVSSWPIAMLGLSVIKNSALSYYEENDVPGDNFPIF
jgi:hypothetical protein